MKRLASIICVFLNLFLIQACSDRNNKTENSSTISNYNESDESTKEEDDIENNPLEDSGCKYDDGTYSASVDYYNPVTGYSATYNLDVEVQDCQIIQINFPNDGYLDEDHITYADIDENGEATVFGEERKTYNITID